MATAPPPLLSRRTSERVTISLERSSVRDSLRRFVDAGDLPALMRWSRGLADHLAERHDPQAVDVLVDALDEEPVILFAAIEALGATADPRAGAALTDLLSHDELSVRSHAAWRLRQLPPNERAVPLLTGLLLEGGTATLHAHRTLRSWAASGLYLDPAVVSALHGVAEPAPRARLVDLLGALNSPHALGVVARVASDEREPDAVRIAAVGALGSHRHIEVVRRLASEDSPVAAAAALALDRPQHGDLGERSVTDGLRIAQLALTARIDGQLSLGGRGDTGGVASLLVSLSEALSRRDDVESILTIGRGSHTDALADDLVGDGSGQSFATVALGDPARPATDAAELWEHYPAVVRGLRRALASTGPLDVLHLRMGDVGTLVGAELAHRAGIPICFSAAADPHNVLHALHETGDLDADRFLAMERAQHVWFRARLVERLTERADRLALFPRRAPDEVFDLLGLRREEISGRTSVVGEGIDLRLRDTAEHLATRSEGVDEPPGALADLARRLPDDRRGRALLVSVGRLHPVKGMARVVRAWAEEPALVRRFNLVIVGGDLDDPSAQELGVLAEIDTIVPPDDPRRAGLMLLGGRPRQEIATLLASADRGRPGWWAPDGVYVDGAMKEEFGLAVLEALAAGLAVVAPHGGPSTYVDHLDTGVLVGPGDPLGAAIATAAELAPDRARRERGRTMVEERFSIDTMAEQLVDLYRPAEITL